MVGGLSIHHGTYVDGVVLHCHSWDPASRTFGTRYEYVREFGRTSPVGSTATSQFCNTIVQVQTQPARGIRGNAVSVVDSLGAICDEP